MPLRDHLRPPLDDLHSWDELRGMWPAVIVQHLSRTLPEPYFAAPGVHLDSLYEVDVGTYRDRGPGRDPEPEPAGPGAGTVATYAPPGPTLTLEPELAGQDTYEVRIFDGRRNRRLVAAIEIVSPSNKARPEGREAFVSKVATLVRHDVCVSMIDVVSTMDCNLYAELLRRVSGSDPALGDRPPPMYAATLRTRLEQGRRLMDAWYHPLAVGGALPTLPIWLREALAVSLDVESGYEEACRTLRIR